MKPRTVLYSVVSLVLTCGIVLAQQAPTPPQAPPAPQAPPSPEVFDLVTQGPSGFTFFTDGGSFLGVHAEDINKENMARYGMREARGVGITEVVKDSPAEKAGLRKDDVILRFDGDSVTSFRKLTRLISEVAPDQSVKLTIGRSGGEQEVSVTIGKRDNTIGAFKRLEELRGLEELKKLEGMDRLQRPPRIQPPDGSGSVWQWEGPGREGMFYSFGNQRRIGVTTIQLTKQLADYFGIADGKGVLVTGVTEGSPAAKAGLRAGDVITGADGEKVEEAGDLSRAVNKKKEGDVTLTIVRDKNQRTITVSPKAPEPMVQPGTIRQARVRTIALPRIELGEFPGMNIVIPRITLPAIPQINVQLPGKILKPRIVRTGTTQPI